VIAADSVQAVFATNMRHGLRIDAGTACTRWAGERLDVGWAIDVLHPLANPAPTQVCLTSNSETAVP
jgi:hypothetical protein